MISIHTPVKGVTLWHSSYASALSISIHTPVKGVTVSTIKIIIHQGISIHTPVKGVTSMGKVEIVDLKFQSTHP